MFVAYLRTFARLGLQAVPVRAPTGPIGGDLSHEFHILADTGESALFYDAALEEVDSRGTALPPTPSTIARLTGLYAMEEEEHAKVAECPVPAERLRSRRGIEVGHIFAFGTKYSASMGLRVQTADGGQVHPQMGSYGIGVSRLMGAIIEASHDDNGIVWPESVAPFRVGLINMRADDGNCASAADEIYGRLHAGRRRDALRRPRRARRRQVRDHGPDRPALAADRRPKGPRERRRRTQAPRHRRARGAVDRKRAGEADGMSPDLVIPAKAGISFRLRRLRSQLSLG